MLPWMRNISEGWKGWKVTDVIINGDAENYIAMTEGYFSPMEFCNRRGQIVEQELGIA